MTDLFDTPIIPGLSILDDFIDASDEADLMARIDAEALSPFRFQGWLGNRLTRSFGWLYDFDNNRFEATDPLPDWLLPLRDRAAAFAALSAPELVQALLIRYDQGAGIGWHRDRPVFEDVIGVSLGEPATMRFRRRRPVGFDRASAPLAPRSIYRLAGEARLGWEHSISPMERTRWSITFRSFTEKARRLAA
ncbi:MAG: alpha-ketoglutarate-dependent dioxygenase AlkB [Sphingomonas sp.]|uniref:alpha-ketoglutarate-dependent dioxygenase AlkB n=1 Tax=Sphingomonas sp. TaxID=28214 RepID=UPI001AC89431|nr:alpha-ketoglutarate-dependent dioxygenase AlkB [Sphingomonas sp.]MBN8814518.1 alpha-ketoglutarate-dependent dioxygenase AlkB [Sphingomonas sp.]